MIIKEEETGDTAHRNVPINDTDLIQSSASQLDKLTCGEKFMSGLNKEGNIPLSITYSNNKTETIFTNGESIIESIINMANSGKGFNYRRKRRSGKGNI